MGNAKSTENGNESGEDVPKVNGEKKKKSDSKPIPNPIKEKPTFTSSQREILKYSMSNAKEGFGERIFQRVTEKREDFRNYSESLTPKERKDLSDKLRDFLHKIVENVTDPDEMENLSKSFGGQQVNLRSCGFKPDFFVGIAEAMTSECVNLDGATHGPTETLMAWSQLTTQVFSAVRDGYYAELRRLRRISNTSSINKESSSEEPAKDDDVASSKSNDELQTNLEEQKAESTQFLAPPPSY